MNIGDYKQRKDYIFESKSLDEIKSRIIDGYNDGDNVGANLEIGNLSIELTL
jgi:hypothetical protein